MEKICTNCYYWWQRKCTNVPSSHYGKEMNQNDYCSKYAQALHIKVEEIEKVQKLEVEKVDHPYHYNKGIEAIDIIESWELNFSLGNAIKYILRSPHKGNQLEDLKKASWYINREIQRLENNK